jgi:hypothetical protein
MTLPAARLGHQRKEACRVAELLHDHGDDAGLVVGNHPLDEILDAIRRLIAGGDMISKRNLAGIEHHREHSRHGAALRDDADTAWAGRDQIGIDEGQRDAIDVVDRAEAVRPLDDNAGLTGDTPDFDLVSHTRLAALGKTGGKDHRRTDLARSKMAHRIEHRHARDAENGAVDALRQRLDAGKRGPSADGLALGIDEMDVAGKIVTQQIFEHHRAERTGRFGRTDDGNRTGLQQPVDVTRRHRHSPSL